GLDRNPSGVERHALAHQSEMIVGSLRRCRPVAQNDQRRWLRAALGNAQNRAHAKLAHAILIDYFAFKSLLGGHLARSFSQASWRQQIARFVDQAAREILRLTQNASLIGRRLRSTEHRE